MTEKNKITENFTKEIVEPFIRIFEFPEDNVNFNENRFHENAKFIKTYNSRPYNKFEDFMQLYNKIYNNYYDSFMSSNNS